VTRVPAIGSDARVDRFLFIAIPAKVARPVCCTPGSFPHPIGANKGQSPNCLFAER